MCLTSPGALSIMSLVLGIPGLFKECAMADPQDPMFTKLRGIIGGYLVDLILEEGAGGVARLVREGLEAKARLEPEDEEQVEQILRRLEGGQRASQQHGGG